MRGAAVGGGGRQNKTDKRQREIEMEWEGGAKVLLSMKVFLLQMICQFVFVSFFLVYKCVRIAESDTYM